jgi:lipoyl-dependent peroxiredoxin
VQSHATASWSGDLATGSGTTTLAGSGAAGPLPVSWSARTEEAAGKTSPEELIAAAHAACFNMAFSNQLAQAGHPADQLDTDAVATFERVEAGWRLTTMALSVTGRVPGMDAATFAEKAEAARTGCPVSNALKGNVDITLRASLA